MTEVLGLMLVTVAFTGIGILLALCIDDYVQKLAKKIYFGDDKPKSKYHE